jgi:putative endonuclease
MPTGTSNPETSRATRRARGQLGEELACRHLTARGYRILARNLRCGRHEIDILAMDGDTLCFVEVRLRTAAAHGSGADSVDIAKQRRIVAAAVAALARFAMPPHRAARFDVVSIHAPHAAAPALELIRDAFQADRR